MRVSWGNSPTRPARSHCPHLCRSSPVGHSLGTKVTSRLDPPRSREPKVSSSYDAAFAAANAPPD